MYLLSTVTVVPLDKHDLFGYVTPLLWSTETKYATQSRVSLLITVCNTHTTASGDIKSFEVSIFTDNCNETNIIRKYVNVIGWGNSYRNFELQKN